MASFEHEAAVVRRLLDTSPQPMQIVEVHFPPGGRVAFETGVRDMRVHQQVWVLEGAIDITLGVERHRLREGDCLAMQLDRPTMFHNPTRKPTGGRAAWPGNHL